MVVVVKKLPANAEDKRDAGSYLGLERYTGGGHGNPLQPSCLENPMEGHSPWGHKESDKTERFSPLRTQKV